MENGLSGGVHEQQATHGCVQDRDGSAGDRAGFKVAEVADRLGITTHSLYAWLRKFGKPDVVQRAELDQSAEIRRLKAKLRRVTEERGILKKAAAYFAKG